jgi:hypothetical protein
MVHGIKNYALFASHAPLVMEAYTPTAIIHYLHKITGRNVFLIMSIHVTTTSKIRLYLIGEPSDVNHDDEMDKIQMYKDDLQCRL